MPKFYMIFGPKNIFPEFPPPAPPPVSYAYGDRSSPEVSRCVVCCCPAELVKSPASRAAYTTS